MQAPPVEFCPNCGHEFMPEREYCENCGAIRLQGK